LKQFLLNFRNINRSSKYLFPKKFMKKLIFAFFAIISLFAVSVFAQSYAVTNAKIVTVSGAIIEKGTVVARNGLIESVGENVKIPADAKVFDATGLTVYPGFIDAYTNLGLSVPQPAAQPAQGQGRGQAPPSASVSNSNYPSGLQPETLAIDQLKAGESQFDSQRNAGITTVLTVPKEGIFNGQSAIINLAGDNVSAMILRPAFGQHVTFTTLRTGQFPVSLLGTFAALRQMFLDAQRLNDWKKQYAANPRGIKRPDADASLEALIPVLNREMPIIFNANEEREIIRSLDFAKEFNLKLIVNGGIEAGKVADRLKKADATVLLSLNFPKKTTQNSPEADPEPLEVLRMRAETPKVAAKLAQAGVKFAFQSGGMGNLADFFVNANKAVENGLSKDAALKAMTLGSAEIFGISDRLGSIEVGKIANIVVSKGDIFSKDKYITHVFVDGKLFEQKPPPKAEDKKPMTATTGDAPKVAQVAGTWALTIEAPGQELPITLILTQQGDKITGQMQAGQLGNSDIKNGLVTANGMSFDATVNFGGQSIDLSVSGKIEGNKISGSVSTPMGAVPFSGSKNP
jgi:imidazolonepropionase-like amidohydrolase